MAGTRLVRWLGARWAPVVMVLCGLALAAPAVTAGFAADDHLHRIVERPDPGVAGVRSRPLDLFVFASGDVDDARALRDVGVFPWWTDLHVRMAFMRPLSSATHAADHALWPDNAPAMLLHNLAWLALVLALVWRFYRRFVAPRWIAVLALGLYAIDDARGPVVGWIANRNGLVALALALPVLLVHDRWRRDGWRPGRWLGAPLLAVALGAGESALAIVAYLAAHALWLDRGPWRARVVALAPYAVVVLAWRALYVHLGYGVAGSGVYLDPGADPVGFVVAAAARLPILLCGQLGLPWSDLGSMYELLGAGVATAMVGLAVVVIAAFGLACARLLRRDATSRFFATGLLLAAVPVASTFPADRLLGFIGLGAMGLMAQLLAAGLTQRELLGDGRARRGAALGVVGLMVLVHVVLAPPMLLVRARSMATIGRILDRADAGIPAGAAIAGRTVILVNPPNDAFGAYVTLMRAARHQVRPAHLYWLATGTAAVTVERVDDRTLRIAPAHGFLRYEADQMLRHPRTRFAVGEQVALSGVTIEIESLTADGRPRTALAHFATALDDPSLVWRRWQRTTYVPYVPPAIGTRDTLPAVDMFELLAE